MYMLLKKQKKHDVTQKCTITLWLRQQDAGHGFKPCQCNVDNGPNIRQLSVLAGYERRLAHFVYNKIEADQKPTDLLGDVRENKEVVQFTPVPHEESPEQESERSGSRHYELNLSTKLLSFLTWHYIYWPHWLVHFIVMILTLTDRLSVCLHH